MVETNRTPPSLAAVDSTAIRESFAVTRTLEPEFVETYRLHAGETVALVSFDGYVELRHRHAFGVLITRIPRECFDDPMTWHACIRGHPEPDGTVTISVEPYPVESCGCIRNAGGYRVVICSNHRKEDDARWRHNAVSAEAYEHDPRSPSMQEIEDRREVDRSWT